MKLQFSAVSKLIAVASAVGLVVYGGGFVVNQVADQMVDWQAKQDASSGQAAARAAYGRLPLSFEPNRGQTDSQVEFLARGKGYTLFLTPKEAVISLLKGQPAGSQSAGSVSGERSVVRMRLIGANPAAKASGQKLLAGKVNYLMGKVRSAWRTGIPTFGRVAFQGVYPGVNMLYYGDRQGQLEYDFVVAPGADPSAIRLSFEGAQGLSLDSKGDLIIQTGGAELRQHKPRLYQMINGKRHAVAGKFTLSGSNEVGFKIGSYSHSRPLIIDPTLS
ncbi:MAG: SBBP repeat-containing protein, partial [Actinomycetota bacterium]